MDSTAAALTAQLRSAHIASLRQSYLDLIEEATRRQQTEARDYHIKANTAYIDQMQKRRTNPQQLKALGLGGGWGDDEAATILADYENTMAELKRRMDESEHEYRYAVEKQTRLMNNALAEYNARIALEDYNESLKVAASNKNGSSSKGNGAGNSGNTVYVPPESTVIVPGDDPSYPRRKVAVKNTEPTGRSDGYIYCKY